VSLATGTVAAVSERFYEVLEETAREAYVMALKDIPPDVRQALREAIEGETDARARIVLRTMLEAVELGDRGMMVCQDTGIPIYWVAIGTARYVDGARISALIDSAVRRATKDTPLRSSIVHPVSRENRQDSTGEGVPVVKFSFVPGAEHLEILMMPKGSGSENWSFLKMLVPADGEAAIRRFILESVVEAGGKACPPLVIGVGIGGTSDQCLALAKESTVRPVGGRHPDPRVAAFEVQMLEDVNRLGIGPQGLGGDTTALDVHVERAWTHNSMNPVAVNMQCWRGERRRARIAYSDLAVEWGY
jgi:fumarate hydratase subunit alpha/L(+)-tartrate dehydratase alpha subunit